MTNCQAKHFDINEDMKEIIIGRGVDCTIRINEKHISKIHCRIYLIDSGYYMLQDLRYLIFILIIKLL